MSSESGYNTIQIMSIFLTIHTLGRYKILEMVYGEQCLLRMHVSMEIIIYVFLYVLYVIVLRNW